VSNLQIEGTCTQLPGQKRCFLPGIIVSSACPKCGLVAQVDLGEIYLSYGECEAYFYCSDENIPEGDPVGCGEEWSEMMRVEINLFPIVIETPPVCPGCDGEGFVEAWEGDHNPSNPDHISCPTCEGGRSTAYSGRTAGPFPGGVS
jgi:hypothetical protein